MAEQKTEQKKPTQAASNGNGEITRDRAILGLVLNIVVLPGVGTLVGGRTNEGVIQLVLFLVGIPLIFVLVGVPLMIGMWIWALITGIDMVNKAK